MQRLISVLYATLFIQTFLASAMEAPNRPGSDAKSPVHIYTLAHEKIPAQKLKNTSFKISFIQAWLENSFDITPHEILFKDYEKKQKTYEVPLEEVPKILEWHKLRSEKIKNNLNTFLSYLKMLIDNSRGLLSTAEINPFQQAKNEAAFIMQSLNAQGKLMLQQDRLIRYFEYSDLEPDEDNSIKIARNRLCLEQAIQQKEIELIQRTKLFPMHADADGKASINEYIECLERELKNLK